MRPALQGHQGRVGRPFLTTAVRKLAGNELVADKPGDQYEVAVSLASDAPVGPVSAQ